MFIFRDTHERILAEREEVLKKQQRRLVRAQRMVRGLKKRLRRELERQPVGSAAELSTSSLPPVILQAVASAPADERVRRNLLEYAEVQLIAGKKADTIAAEIIAGETGPDTDDYLED